MPRFLFSLHAQLFHINVEAEGPVGLAMQNNTPGKSTASSGLKLVDVAEK